MDYCVGLHLSIKITKELNLFCNSSLLKLNQKLNRSMFHQCLKMANISLNF